MQLISAKGLRALLLVVVLGFVSSAALLFGQGTNGSLTGQVTDPSGAAIPGATVALTDVDTNYTQNATTDGQGVYQFKLVRAGNYSLTVAAGSFAQYVQKGIVINANLYATQNVQLKVAKAKGETINVTADAELIDTTSAELGMTVNEQSVSELPLNGRDPSTLALLAPGMVDAGKAGVAWAQSGFSFPSESAASANGGRIGSTFYMLDGVSNMDTYLGSNSPTPNSDATQEFRLISNNFSAVYGFSTGGVVSMATRSGTNQWHGGLFEFMRNGDLDAGNWSNHAQDTYRRNQFGGYVGAPVIKDKLFAFFNYQGTVVVGGPGTSTNFTTTPTQQMLTGDFSGLVDYAEAHNSACGSGYTGPQTLNCGWLNGPFQVANGKPNQLVGVLDPVAVQVTNDGLPGHSATASGTAAPTSGAQNLAGQMLYASAALANSKFNEYTGRVDYDLSKSQRLTVRSFVDKFVQPSGDTPGNVLSVLNLNTWNQTFGENMWYFNEILQHTWTVNASTVNTATVLWTQQSSHNGTPVTDHSGKNMCWSRYISITEPVCYMEGANFGGANGGWTEPSDEVRSTEGISDTLIKTIHRHTVSAGIDLIHQRAVEDAANYPADAIIGFGGGYTGSGLADWLLGYMSSFEQGAGELADIQGWMVDPYFNDEFRIKPGMTLTLGLRWDPDFAPVSVGGRGAAFVPGQQSVMFPAAPSGLVFPGDSGVDAALRPSSKYFFEPRIGVAWQPKKLPHTSFHGAFGIFSGPVPYSDYNHVVDIAPFATALAPPAPSNIPLCGDGCTPNTGQTITGYMNFHDPYSTSSFGTNGVSPFPPFASVNYKPPSNSLIPGPVYVQDSFGRNFKAGKTQAWNATVEQQIGNTMAIRVAYVGSESYHQSYVQDDNFAGYSYCTSFTSAACPIPQLAPGPVAPYSNFTGILEYDSGATANYHSLQATFQRHMSHGLQAQSSFTWQKTIDVASGANIAASQNGITNPKDLHWSRGVSSASVPFTWTTNFVYRSPELKGQNAVLQAVLGGWEVSPIANWASGSPFSINGGNPSAVSAYNVVIGGQSTSEPNEGDGCLQFCAGDRADRVPGVPLNVRQGKRADWVKQYFNPAAFVTRHDGTFGNSARDIMYGPPAFNTDASLMKNWSILERYKLQLRFEFFNAFNHVVMGNPDNNPHDSDGCSAQINCGSGSDAATPREIQAALKFTF
ncbi:MAG: carboxypeptidase-like regulatory domain-containing protein [Terracidiphilus sp.]|nr:carboxypeptidase-like regulatory domain-containing protein [Terracidiphilus sp.]